MAARSTREGHNFNWEDGTGKGKCANCKLRTQHDKVKGSKGGMHQGYLVEGKWQKDPPVCAGKTAAKPKVKKAA